MPEKHESPGKEISFLPPLRMLLSFFDKDARAGRKESAAEDPEQSKEKTVEKLIEKLNEKEAKD